MSEKDGWEWVELREKADRLRAEIERLRAALQNIANCQSYLLLPDDVVALARAALANQGKGYAMSEQQYEQQYTTYVEGDLTVFQKYELLRAEIERLKAIPSKLMRPQEWPGDPWTSGYIAALEDVLADQGKG
jgi:uncharacterized small protein (DUF1192 family)